MGSRKEEERNEKIIRGLMKLPPNRRCINCNSLGPQYVCSNFWTFVCTTCSGIHREFTHRVKSVSMSKFTSQEVEALQNGGNQRAREIYLKNWDIQRQRLPGNSNVNKVREFIKNVYVDGRYAGGKTSDKPPKDTQGLGSRLDETRRASSYHSYSESPPYDYQYEDRRYGKHGAVLNRKPGSERGHYVGKISTLVYSPGRMSEQIFEDRFANEGSGSRISDYSVSSGGEKDVGFNSPHVQPSRNMSSSKENLKRDVDGIPHPKRATSLGSMGSFDSNSMSLKSYSSGGLTDVVSERDRAAGACLDKMSTFSQSHGPVNYGGLDLFEAPVVPKSVSAAPSIDLFQLPETSAAAVNMFQMSPASSAPCVNTYQPAQISSYSSLDFFHFPEQPSTTNLDRNPQELSIPKSEGWGTFDTPPPAASIPGTERLSPAIVPGNEVSSVKFYQFQSSNTSMLWPAFQNSGANGPSPSSDPWPANLHNVQAPAIATSTLVGSPSSDPWLGNLHNGQAPAIAKSTQSWNAFDDSTIHLPLEVVKQDSEPHLAAYKPSPTPDQCLTIISQHETNDDGNLRIASHDGPPSLTVPSQADMGPLYTPSVLPLMGELQAHAEHKSTNPFDFPCDSDLEQSSMFLDMSSLQAALPNAEFLPLYLGGAAQSWFPQNPVTSFVPAGAQGGLAYMSGQAPTAQLTNIPTQEPVASVGGNPFA